MNKVYTLLLLILCSHYASAQKFGFMARGNISSGMEYRSLDFDGSNVLYSPGGGMGFEVGAQSEISTNLNVTGSLGYQQHGALQLYSVNGVGNKTSFSFNRIFFSMGISKVFDLKTDPINGIILGMGFSYHSPGNLERTENNINLGTSTYNPNFGWYLESGLQIKIANYSYINPTLRYRNLSFDIDSFDSGNVTSLPDYLQKLNANGIEVGITFIQKFELDPFNSL